MSGPSYTAGNWAVEGEYLGAIPVADAVSAQPLHMAGQHGVSTKKAQISLLARNYICLQKAMEAKSSWSGLTQDTSPLQVNAYKMLKHLYTRYLNIYLNDMQNRTLQSDLVSFLPLRFTSAI